MTNTRFITDHLTIEKRTRTLPFTMSTKHFHNECEIYYLLEGTGKYFIDNDSYPIQKGSLVIINSLQVHSTEFKKSDSHERILIELKAEELEEKIFSICQISIQQFFRTHSGIYHIEASNQLYMLNILSDLLFEARNKFSNYEIMMGIKLAELLIFLSRHENKAVRFTNRHNLQLETSKVIKNSMEYIHSHLDQPLSLDVIATHLFINKSYLSRVFKEVTGFTVHEYINIQRVKQAKSLLEIPTKPMADIAKEVGYNSVNYFERMFKKYTETTPLKYRQRFLLINEKVRSLNFNEIHSSHFNEP